MNKAEEIEILKSFRSSWQDFPRGKIEKSESPDFILRPSVKRSIGLEITKIYFTDPTKAVDENIQNKIKVSQFLEVLHEAIFKKEDKLKLYRKKRTDFLWLIIVSENLIDSISFNFLNLIEKINFKSGFDKLFLFDLKRKSAYELRSGINE